MQRTSKHIEQRQACLKRGSFPLYRTNKRWAELQTPRCVQWRGQTDSSFVVPGQVSDYKGAAQFLDVLPKAKELLADRGYDADWFRNALLEKGITPCIPARKTRKVPATYDKELYKQRHKIENMFGRIKDWRRIAMRYDRCAHTFFSAICLDAVVIFYLS